MSSSAELLRRAAVKLRQDAEAATPGPWTARGDRYPHLAFQGSDDADNVMSFNLAGKPAEDARYAALMHPPVALALADLLDGAADHADFAERIGLMASGLVRQLNGLARAVLREPEETP